MASRSDQLHSHQFTLQRVVGALAMRDPDPDSSPMRRIGGALFASVMFAVLAVAAVGVYGLLRPGGGDAWRGGNAMIIEKESGARFVYRNDTLYPVANYASALLILGNHQSPVQVSAAKLVGVPRGTTLGITGVPDPLPGREQLVTTAWTLCSRPPVGPPGASVSGTESVLRVGTAPASEPFGAQGVLATDQTGGLHLLWNNRRYAISNASRVITALSWSQTAAVAMPAAVLNAIPAGADLGGFTVPRANKPSRVSGYQVGDVISVNSVSGQTFHVAMEDGLADVTPVQAGLLLADGAGGGKARDMSATDKSKAQPSQQTLIPTGDNAPPATAPKQVRPSAQGGICATYQAGAAIPELRLADAVRPETGEVRTARTPGDPGVVVDWVAVPPGRGALVEALPSSSAPAGSLALVSDLGLRFPIPSAKVLEILGYSGVTPQKLPAAVVALLPSGKALEQDAAGLPAST